MSASSAAPAPAPAAASSGDFSAEGVLRLGGRVYIWLSIAGSVVTAIVALLVIVYFSAMYRKGWTSSQGKVTAETCGEEQQQDCDDGHCVTKTMEDCTLTVEGFGEMRNTYSKATLPKKGDEVTVYYDPADKSTATLSAPISATLAVGIAAIVLVISVLFTAFLFHVKNNANAQGLAGVFLAADVLKS